jgi:hypothetical protein
MKSGSELRNRGKVFRYFAVYASFRVNSIRQFRYFTETLSRERRQGGKPSPSMRDMYFCMRMMPLPFTYDYETAQKTSITTSSLRVWRLFESHFFRNSSSASTLLELPQTFPD